MHITTVSPPSILAPAGNKASFLAALVAGADAIYCGLKSLSARMAAVNFTLEELVPLVALAHDRGVRVYITLNSLLKPDEVAKARDIVDRLHRYVQPDALIIQDLAYVHLARQAGFTGELHLSTLANVSFPRALATVRHSFNIDRVVMPRELTVDEIKIMADACPEGMGLELFIHGALCYGVSGRCYWSSYMGGKSGLRGVCVQPCRRRYTVDNQTGRYFSCQDLSLDVLTKVLLSIPKIRAWKIEGRRKGPHYVYYTVQAYRMLRDEGRDPQAKKAALGLLAQALGRPGTHYNFLSQRPQSPMDPGKQTGSGLLVGNCRGPRNKPYITPREALLPGDLLRTGYEDDPWHTLYKVRQSVPKRGRYYLKALKGKMPKTGTPVFLVDRLEKALAEKINALEGLLSPVMSLPGDNPPAYLYAKTRVKRRAPKEIQVARHSGKNPGKQGMGIWLTGEPMGRISKTNASRVFWWLPPVVWPVGETALADSIRQVVRAGGRRFVLNAPWQVVYFEKAPSYDLWAGPFCNLSNPVAINTLASLGVSGAILTPELGEKDLLMLPRHSEIPLGMVVSGNWPLCISRGVSGDLKHGRAFVSPRGEQAWVSRYGPDDWVFPNWRIDLGEKKDRLIRAGFQLFIHLMEPIPKGVSIKRRPGLWNWRVGLK